MPTYSYRCTECGTAFDIQQAFTDDSLTECPTCEGKLRKLFNAVGVTFNGSGNRAVTLDRSGKLFLWDSTNGNVRFHQQLPVRRATSLAFAPDGSEVFVAGSDKRVLKIVIPTNAR